MSAPSTPPDGGPAFPKTKTSCYPPQDGMSLRDYFAGQALAGLLADHTLEGRGEDWAAVAYNAAEAMIAERAKRK